MWTLQENPDHSFCLAWTIAARRPHNLNLSTASQKRLHSLDFHLLRIHSILLGSPGVIAGLGFILRAWRPRELDAPESSFRIQRPSESCLGQSPERLVRL